jgi:hypothetical protein
VVEPLPTKKVKVTTLLVPVEPSAGPPLNVIVGAPVAVELALLDVELAVLLVVVPVLLLVAAAPNVKVRSASVEESPLARTAKRYPPFGKEYVCGDPQLKNEFNSA